MNNSNKIVKNLLDIQLITLTELIISTLLSRPVIYNSAKMDNLCTLDIKLRETYDIVLTKVAMMIQQLNGISINYGTISSTSPMCIYIHWSYTYSTININHSHLIYQ
ncbi:unnamed protein product [Rotaria sordida]|uniref:Uncharacterized protein n=1 Tax=Rotaria sordida TaxID=392033 RepID=A0A819QM08_9BILA|nr:unnamed protein product [Rotaria sordida]CAF4033270.1 unnamed protein product [Rotaria sordida]